MKTPCHCATSEHPGRYVSLFKNEVCASCNGTEEVEDVITMASGCVTGRYRAVPFKTRFEENNGDWYIVWDGGIPATEAEILDIRKLSYRGDRFAALCPIDRNNLRSSSVKMLNLMLLLYTNSERDFLTDGTDVVRSEGKTYDSVQAFDRMKADGVFG